MQIVHLSDSHISQQFPQRQRDLQLCIDSVNNLPETPDLVIHTGDVSHDGLPEEYEIAKSILNELTVPLVVMPGNRDDRATLTTFFENLPLFTTHNGFVQYSLEQFDVRLIIIDTVSDTDSKGSYCEKRFAHLADMLERDTSRATYLFSHHTPFKVEEIPHPFQFENWQEVEKLQQLLQRHSQVKGLFCGHVHRNVESAIGNIPVSSITCMACDLRKGQMTEKQRTEPAFRTIELSAA